MKVSFSRKLRVGGLAVLAVSSLSFATITVENGSGWVGKGDVQLPFEWNNKELQDCVTKDSFTVTNPCIKFSSIVTATVTTTWSWVCTNSSNENVQNKSRISETSSATQYFSSVAAREKNQITGFKLSANGQTVLSSKTETEGPPINQCPNGNDWSNTQPADPAKGVVDTDSVKKLKMEDQRESGETHQVSYL
jgi:hypothetical protein